MSSVSKDYTSRSFAEMGNLLFLKTLHAPVQG